MTLIIPGQCGDAIAVPRAEFDECMRELRRAFCKIAVTGPGHGSF